MNGTEHERELAVDENGTLVWPDLDFSTTHFKQLRMTQRRFQKQLDEPKHTATYKEWARRQFVHINWELNKYQFSR